MKYDAGQSLIFTDGLKIKYRSKYELYQPCFYNDIFPKQIDFICSDEFKDSYYDIECNVYYSENLLEDGYKIKITKNEIAVYITNERSIQYAFKALTNYVYLIDDVVVVEIVEVIENPAYKYRGVIEGFYGNPYTFEQRIDLFNFMNENKLNTYFYAPKDDLKHRSEWRLEYNQTELNKFITLIKSSSNNMVDFVYCISPGKDISFSNEVDYMKLLYKLKQLLECGCTKFAILFDDVDPKLSREDQKFINPAIAQSILTNKIYEDMKQLDLRIDFFFCPTEYYGSNATSYKKNIGSNLNKEIKIFFTGPEVLSNKIDEAYIKELRDILDNDIIIWDNIPVNDFAESKQKIQISPFKNRYDSLFKYNVVGYFSNPMIQYEASKIPLINMADYMWNASNFDVSNSFKESLYKYDKKCAKHLYILSSILTNQFLVAETKPQIKVAVYKKNYNYLLSYYANIADSITFLTKNLNENLLKDLQPTFNKFTKSKLLLEKIADGKYTLEEIEIYINDTEHRISSDIIEEIYSMNYSENKK